MLRLIHTADLHPTAAGTLAGKMILDPVTGQNITLTDLKNSLEFVTSVALDPATRCDAVLIPGDLWDSPRPHANEVRVVREAIMSLARTIPVVCCSGNHDVSNNPNDATALECLKGLSNVYVAETPSVFALSLGGQPAQIFCLPYPRKSGLLADDAHKDKSPEEITALINHGLASILRGFHAQFTPRIPHILLAHGSVANCKVNDQPRSLASDILIPLDELASFDFSALGHIHQAQPLNNAGTAWYSGSLTRGGFGEEKEPKGCCLVELAQGFPPNVRFVPNPYARVYRTLTASDLDDDLLAKPLDPAVVWRFKDQLNAGDYHTLKPILDRLQAETPLFQLDVELLTEDRARDAGMSKCLSMEDALTRALSGTIAEPEWPAVFEKHQRLVQECAA